MQPLHSVLADQDSQLDENASISQCNPLRRGLESGPQPSAPRGVDVKFQAFPKQMVDFEKMIYEYVSAGMDPHDDALRLAAATQVFQAVTKPSLILHSEVSRNAAGKELNSSLYSARGSYCSTSGVRKSAIALTYVPTSPH